MAFYSSQFPPEKKFHLKNTGNKPNILRYKL